PLDRAGEGAGGLGADHPTAETEHGALEGEPGPRARLVEERGHDPAVEAIVADSLERAGPTADVVDQLAVELVRAEDVVEEPGAGGGDGHRGPPAPAAARARGATAAGGPGRPGVDPLACLTGRA